jgi:hypothetical protein
MGAEKTGAARDNGCLVRLRDCHSVDGWLGNGGVME